MSVEFLNLLQAIEKGNAWPVQLLQGWVIALEKEQGASKVSQYKPVIIFALAYKVWSSIRAKYILRHLRQIAPEFCAGNLPNKSTCDVWYSIICSIEMAHHTAQELSGAAIDLVKCFKLLPHIPGIMITRHFNVSPQILQGRSEMRRRFKPWMYTGPKILSNTGLPKDVNSPSLP